MMRNGPERASDLPKTTQHSQGEWDGHRAFVFLSTRHTGGGAFLRPRRSCTQSTGEARPCVGAPRPPNTHPTVGLPASRPLPSAPTPLAPLGSCGPARSRGLVGSRWRSVGMSSASRLRSRCPEPRAPLPGRRGSGPAPEHTFQHIPQPVLRDRGRTSCVHFTEEETETLGGGVAPSPRSRS